MTNKLNKSITPEKLWLNYNNGSISETDAIKLIVLLIEKEGKSEVRMNGLRVLEKIGINGEEQFKILESSLISDDDGLVRITAANLIRKYYPKRGLEPLKWAIQNDNSYVVLKSLFGLADKISDHQIKAAKSKRIKELSEQFGIVPNEMDFIFDLLIFLNKNGIDLVWSDLKEKYLEIDPDDIHDSEDYLFFDRFHGSFHGEKAKYLVKNRNIISLYTPTIKSSIGTFPDSIDKLSKLEYLSLYLSKSIPKSLCSLQNLKGLFLRSNKRLRFPDDVANLKSLEEVALTNSFFHPVSKSLSMLIGQSNALKYVKQGVNKEDAITLGLLEAHIWLKLYDEDDKKAWIDEYSVCYKIDEKGRVIKISTYHSELGLECIPPPIFSFQYLEELIISDSLIECIPYKIKNLRLLRKLDLTFNPIKCISDSIKTLNHLEQLDLVSWELKEFPEVLLSITSLKYLNLKDTQITKIPDSISNLKNLEFLGLPMSYMEYIPKSIKSLKSLKNISEFTDLIKD